MLTLLRHAAATLLSVAITFGLSACGGEPCHLSQQAMHLLPENVPQRHTDGSVRYPKPLGVWSDDPALGERAHRILRSSSVRELALDNQLQCSAAGCTDCFICTGTIRWTEYAYGKKPLMCNHVGDVTVHLEFGPGPKAQAKALYVRK